MEEARRCFVAVNEGEALWYLEYVLSVPYVGVGSALRLLQLATMNRKIHS
jgi:hypothetical protein